MRVESFTASWLVRPARLAPARQRCRSRDLCCSRAWGWGCSVSAASAVGEVARVEHLLVKAGETFGVIRVAGAFVLGDLRIGAQRARPLHRAVEAIVQVFTYGQIARSDAVFHPMFERITSTVALRR